MTQAQYEVRPATRDDLRTVAGWVDSAQACSRWAGARVAFPIDLASLPEAIEFAAAESFALECDGTLCAFGQVVPKPGGRRHLARLIVVPGARRAGHGRALASHLVRAALAHVPPVVSLNVAADNAAAIGLYHSLGFREAERPRDEAPSPSLYLEARPSDVML